MSKTHNAVVTVAVHAPLAVHQVPTVEPTADEVLVRVEWTASTPLDLHQNDGGLLVKHPQILGDGIAGTVVEVGPEARRLKVGDKVFGFAWRSPKEKAYQEFATVSEYLLGILPDGFTLQEAVTLPNNFVTVFHAVTADLKLSLPWPKPEGWKPEHADSPILIWGGASSVGMFALQILTFYGYKHLYATASPKNHSLLREYGAKKVFDYRDKDIVKHLREAVPNYPFILDCIGSKEGSLKPLAEVAKKGDRVAVLLPVIVKDSSDTTEPEYAMGPEDQANWAEGSIVEGVRTHFYLQNEEFKEKLQSEIMPALLAQKIVTPNKQKHIEGSTLLERAQKAMNALRNKEASAERLVWRVSEAS